MSETKRRPYLRDVYLAQLIDGARRTQQDGFPIIEGWMIAKEPPKYVVQWDKKGSVQDYGHTGICFYCVDQAFTSILNHPGKKIEYLSQFHCIIGPDASPYDNMPLVVQKSQIYINLAITYYWGSKGLNIIPNVRLGNNETLSSLTAYPKNHLIAIGTNGFLHKLDNRKAFSRQVTEVVNQIQPSGIIVYGPAPDSVFHAAVQSDIPIYQFDSFMMLRNKTLSNKKEYNNER